MKKFVIGFVSGALLFGVLGVGASGVWDKIDVLKNDINVVVNGSDVAADNFVYNDTTYIPLRAVSDALGVPVNYDEESNTAFIGERKEETMIKSKYTPPEDIINDYDKVTLKEGVYYITTQFLFEKLGRDNVNFSENLYILTLPNGSKKEYKPVVIGDRPYIPYDTYVDEIEPLLK